MIRIFITEYIIFLDELDLWLIYDNFFSQYQNFLVQEIPPYYWLDFKRPLITDDLTLISKTKLWRYNVPLFRFRNVAKQGFFIYYSHFLVPRVWFRASFFSRGLPYHFIYLQFYNLNNLVGYSYINFERFYDYYEDINIRSLDVNLLYDSVYGIFPLEKLQLMEWIFRRTRVRFYKLDPYKYEWLLIGLSWYPPYLKYSLLNPSAVYLTPGICYARKWLIYAYMTYNQTPPVPRSLYMYNLSTFFSTLDLFGTGFTNIEIKYFINKYILFDCYILQIYLKLNFFFCLSLFSIYYCNKKKLFSFVYMLQPLYFFSSLIHRIFVVSSYLRRFIRLRNYYYLKKKHKRGFNRKSETENYYFNLIRKHLFRNLLKLFNKYILNFRIYINKINNSLLFNTKDFKIIYCFYLVLLMLFYFFLSFLIYLKNFIYYIYYFYCLKIMKHISFKNSLFLYVWLIPEIVILRDIQAFDAFEVMKRYLNFKRFYKKKEYNKFVKEKIWAAYELRMWQNSQIDELVKQQYVNYFYHRYFFDYEPWYELMWVLIPRFLSRVHLKIMDFSQHKNFNLYHVGIILSNHKYKYYFIKKIRNYRIAYILNCFFSFNFWKLYYFYVYKLTINKSTSYFKFIQIWLIYLYKWNVRIYLFITYALKFLFTPQRMLIPYYFYKSSLIAYNYLKSFIIFFYLNKYFLIVLNFIYITIYYLYQIIYTYINKFFFFIIKRINGFGFFLFRDSYGISYNFWYKYYMLKFYLIEYNIIYNFFISLRDIIFNFIIIFSFLYIFFSLPFISYLISDNLLFLLEDFSNFLYSLTIVGYIDYTLNISNLYNLNKIEFQALFDNFVLLFTNNFANYYLDLNFYIGNRLNTRTIWIGKRIEREQLTIMFRYLIEHNFRYLGIDFEYFHNKYTPNFARWWIFFYVHLYLILRGDPSQFMMWEGYWYHFLPISFHWVYKMRYHLIYIHFILPCFWIWQYLAAYITFYFLYWSHFVPILNYIVFYIVKFFYIIYSYIYLFILYSSYFYWYYFFAGLPKLYIYLTQFSMFSEIFRYDSLKFYISLDILNFIRLIFNTIYIILYYFFSGIFLYFYKLIAWILMFFGFNYYNTLDFFSYNYMEEFRSFTGRLFTELLPLHYDLNEYNGIFDNRIHYRVGSINRRMKIKNNRLVWFPFINHIKYRTITFEYKLRGFLFKDTHFLNNMILYEHLFQFRHWNLFYYMLFALYFRFFLILFFTGVLFIKFIDIFKDTRYISHSGTYEWKRNFIKKNKAKFGLDDFYWLYNIRWLKGFEFYLDKNFTDDLYVYRFERNKLRFGMYLYNNLNDFFLTGNTSFSEFFEDNRYHKFRRYYFDRYTIFIKDIDYLFHIFSVSKRHLKMRSKIFQFFKFDFLFFKKKRHTLNYMYDNEILRKLDRMDYVWLFYVTPYFLYGRDWYDMKILSQSLISREFYANVKKSLFKAYAIFEMNQKEFPFDLFEFQFFDKDFYSEILENYGHDFNIEEADNPILRKVTYSRFHTTLLYTSFDTTGFKKIYNFIGYEEFLNKIENYLIYLKKINKNYFNNFIDFNLFSFMESISYTLTHINPDIAKTAVDIDKGNLIGVSYKKSMLLDEFSSTEITENVFNAVDNYLKKSNYNNIEIFNMLLREDRVTIVRAISPWWIVFAMIPFFFLYLEFDVMFKYGRFIIPHLALIEGFQFVLDQLFGIYFADNYAWHGIWLHDHKSYNKRLRYQFKNGHIRGYVWDLRWADLHSFWVGKSAYLKGAKTEYAYTFVYWLNDFYHRTHWYTKIWDYYFKDFYKYFFIRFLFILIDIIAFIIVVMLIYFFVYIYYHGHNYYRNLRKDNFENDAEVEYRKTGDAYKAYKSMKQKEKEAKDYRNRDVLIDIAKEIDKHKKLVEFIEDYKEKQKKKEENKKNL